MINQTEYSETMNQRSLRLERPFCEDCGEDYAEAHVRLPLPDGHRDFSLCDACCCMAKSAGGYLI